MKILDSIVAMARGEKPQAAKPDTSASTAAAATPPTSDEREEILAFIKKFFEPVRTSDGGLEARSRAPVPNELIAHVARTAGPLLDEAQLAAARALADEWSAGTRALNSYGRDRVSGANAEHQQAIAAAEIDGKPFADGWTKTDIETDFASRRAALKVALREKSHEAGQIFQIASGKVVIALRTFAEESAVQEFRSYAKFGVPFVPSRLTETLLAAAARLEWQSEKLAGGKGILGTDPRAMFASLGIDL